MPCHHGYSADQHAPLLLEGDILGRARSHHHVRRDVEQLVLGSLGLGGLGQQIQTWRHRLCTKKYSGGNGLATCSIPNSHPTITFRIRTHHSVLARRLVGREARDAHHGRANVHVVHLSRLFKMLDTIPISSLADDTSYIPTTLACNTYMVVYDAQQCREILRHEQLRVELLALRAELPDLVHLSVNNHASQIHNRPC